MRKCCFYFFMLLATMACSKYPAEVERVLRLAGENREELEKVLVHYGKRSEDRLKLKSAYFLIANMPYHHTAQNAQLDSFKIYLQKNVPRTWSWIGFRYRFGDETVNNIIKPDIQHVTSEYLIWNIDFSFKVWQEAPWMKSFSFTDFCEEILPYRLSNEPLEYWKEEYYSTFRPIIDTMAHSDNPHEVCMKLLNHIILEQGWTMDYALPSAGIGASFLLEKRYGSCREQAEFITYVLRSVGIPSGIDVLIQDPVSRSGTQHAWNYTRNNTGKRFSFDYFEICESAAGLIRASAKKLGKVYQRCFSVQKETLPVKYKNKYIPQGELRNFLLRDVSCHYFSETHISVCLDSPGLVGRNDIVYLCVLNNNREWIPITWSKARGGTVKFSCIEPGILYQLRLIDVNRNIALCKPFILRSNENAQYIATDTNSFQSMTLFRKFRLPMEWSAYVSRSVNGKFQGANRSDFSDSVTLHTIQKVADFSYENIGLEHPQKFRFVRYLSADGGHNNMAEMQFYSEGKKLKGKIIGTDGFKKDFPNSEKEAVFDNDPLTFFDALEADGAWVGLELEKPYPIEAIRYIFRNDDNNIRPGDTYELLYHHNEQWLSAGLQTADTIQLHYEKVPAQSLYWLRNHTRGREERPFTYENDKQVWW